MTIYLTHHSAMEYWLGPYVVRADKTRRLSALPSTPLPTGCVDAERLAFMGIKSTPIHTTVYAAAHRSRQTSVTSHLHTGAFPAGSFEHLRGEYWVASPELCFCQMANELPFAEEVRLGYELCARFRRNDFTDDLDEREPLTGESALLRFLDRCQGMPGHRTATRAARYVSEHAESPMEIAVAMLLTLSRHRGGYGLPHAVLNREITVTGRTDRSHQKTYRVDMAWPEKRLIVEYDSDLHHRAKPNVIADAKRRNDLQDAGWRVAALTWDQVRSPQLMDEAAAQLARALGVRLPKSSLEQDFRRQELRATVLDWAVRAQGMPR